jgi:cytoskeletal protein RodZ
MNSDQELERREESPTEMSLSQILKSKRQQLKIETSEIATYLKIKLRDIEAIENGDLSKLTKHLYTLGLIRSYAKFLKIDARIIEEKIKLLNVESNVSNKKYQLINIGENTDLTPDKNSLFDFLIISILLFLTLLSIYNFCENKSASISNKTLIEEFKKIDS